MTALVAPIQVQPDRLWAYVLKLMRLRWVISISGFRRAKPPQKMVTIGLGLLVVGVFVGSYLLTRSLLRQLDSPLIVESGINPAALMEAILTLVVSSAFLFTTLTSFRVLLQALYLARDMDFLVAAPIPMRAVFLGKLLDAALPNLVLVMAFGLPVLLSLGATRGYHAVYYPLVFLVLTFLSFAAAGIASLLVMAVVRIFPANRVAEVLTLLGAILIIGLSQSINLMGDSLESLSPEQISAGAGVLSRLNSAWFPLAWAGRSLVDLGQGRWLSGIFFLALTIGLSTMVFWLALTTAERLYYTGWASLQVGTQRKRNRRAVERRDMSGLAAAGLFRCLLPSEVRAIVVKDLKLIRRDLTNLSQVIGGLIMGVVFAVMLLRGGGEPPAGSGDAPTSFTSLVQSGMLYGSMVIGLFVGWVFLARLALVGFSMEGKSYWMLKSAPLSAGKQLAAKFLMAYLPTLALSWIYLLGVALLQHAALITILYGLPAIALILAGLGGINLAFGVRGANLTWTDPRKMENGVAGVLGTIASIVYQLAALLLFFGPPLGLPLLGISEGTGMLVGLLAGGTVALLCTTVPIALVKERVYRIGEE
jgi:ABC-2 type transport system permease protein